MNINEYSYDLPDQLIAQHPPTIRGQARLLLLNKNNGDIQHKHYVDIVDYFMPGDLVVLNNTRVIKARLIGTDPYGKEREFLLLERHESNINLHHWKVLYKGKIHRGETYHVGKSSVSIEDVYEGGLAAISSNDDLMQLSEQYGTVPLPPYMKRQADQKDIERYQTEFAKEAGSVAAPTASLNFTNDIQEKLRLKGVNIAYLTLHVGLGTFLPIRTDELENHIMHSEYYEIPKTTVELICSTKQKNGRVIGIGTTVTRTLEFAHNEIMSSTPRDLSGEADIFIYPGYQFKLVNALLTNFHAPKTTVLMLTAAFAGWENIKAAYEAAVHEQYQFLSYGDSMLIY